MITIKEFCESTGMKPKTVYKRLENNKNGVLKGHISKEKGKPYMLDDEAQDFIKSAAVKLNDFYSVLNEVRKECEETVDKNCELEDTVSYLESEKDELSEKLSAALKELEMYKSELEKCRSEIDKCHSELSEKDKIIADLRSELDSERDIFKTVLEDKSGIISERDSTISELETVIKSNEKKGLHLPFMSK